jgi:predicted Zn-dependent peptidase
MEYSTFVLPNGIRCIYQSRESPTVHVGLWIGAGSRDESSDKEGLAHFIEHALFKGTKRRKAYHILNRLDTVGAELNAFTTKEETCIHASCMNHDFSRSLELLHDMAFNSTFPEKELEKEKSVIVEEIQSNLDSPYDQIFDEFESLLFGEHQLGGTILGTDTTVTQIDRSDIQQFTDSRYLTDHMVISVVGGLRPKRIEQGIKKHFGSIPKRTGEMGRVHPRRNKPFNITRTIQTHQAHCILGNHAYSTTDSRKMGLVLLNNVLGGPTMNNRLSLELREKRGLAYHVESMYTAYSDAGIWMIYIGTEKQNLSKAQKWILEELNKLMQEPLGTRQLSMAKKQLKGQIALNQENGANVMLSIGKALLKQGEARSMEQISSIIDAITSEELQAIAQDLFKADELSYLTYL